MANDIPHRPVYPSDLTGEQWEKVRPLVENLPGVSAIEGSARGKPAWIDPRIIVNAILYQSFTGVPWRFLPRDIHPKWESVYKYALKWEETGVTGLIFDALNILPPPKERGVPRARRARTSPGSKAASS